MHTLLRERLIRDERLVHGIRSFFAGRGYLEVETPCLSPFLIPEPSIEVFRTTFHAQGGARVDLYLAPSPELWMKRLLARGSGDIFQIARTFRDADFGGRLHNPEFRLLEWYTIGASYLDQVPITEELLARLASGSAFGARGERLSPPFRRITVEEAFADLAQIDLGGSLETEAMVEAARRRGCEVRGDSTWEQAFHAVYLSLVEPELPSDRPLILADWPAKIPTTARGKAGTPWAERWELLIDRVEIANCYSEETDPGSVRKFLDEETERKRGCRTVHPTDESFARIFESGFPACAGVALGVDRLAMALAGERSLQGVMQFPLSAIVAENPVSRPDFESEGAR